MPTSFDNCVINYNCFHPKSLVNYSIELPLAPHRPRESKHHQRSISLIISRAYELFVHNSLPISKAFPNDWRSSLPDFFLCDTHHEQIVQADAGKPKVNSISMPPLFGVIRVYFKVYFLSSDWSTRMCGDKIKHMRRDSIWQNVNSSSSTC